jgi:hypothetical protein
MSNAPSEIRYEINKEPLFDASSLNSSLTHTLSDGISVEAHVEGGRIVGYTAYDASGKPLPVRRMQLTDAAEASGDLSTRMGGAQCWYCICNGSCQCWPEPCPQ